ncbi:MAG TPA: N-6 DNA methylase [Ktedonobacteraceae bacterium]|nr:N-6 DNA methylase [Ktedonobacteraceae bacterium]
MQALEAIEPLVRQLKPILRSIRKQVHAQFNGRLLPVENNTYSKPAVEAYNAWQAFTNGTYTSPQAEFCLQTAYLQFVYAFFVRVCEDHEIIPHLVADESLAFTIKNTYLSLLKKLYPPVCSYNHFGSQDFFDWFTPDPQSFASLFHLLHRYDFKDAGRDVLGRIFDEGFIEQKGRSEKGQFYTPGHIVEYMLNTLGMPSKIDEQDNPGYKEVRAFLAKTVGDISCGSGSFLVAVAARKRAILQHLVAAHEVSPAYALQIMSNTLLGFDLNPFACYLSEINLLVQCLPFLTNEQGQICRSVGQLHIYCIDALDPISARQINLLAGCQGLDYLLGNPPYVSAGESSEHLRYREKVSDYGMYQLLYQRWDLFVAFFERNLQLLKSGGRLGLIVSSGIETEGYAEPLRGVLSTNYSLLQIDFFPGLRLFQDAAVESTMVFLENRIPDREHEVVRRRHFHADHRQFETLLPVSHSARNGNVFRWRFNTLLEKHITEDSIPLCAIAYIGTGIEAQSDEYFDPIIDGKRQKRFTLDDVFLPPAMGEVRPPEYIDDGVLGDDVDRYYLRRTRFVAYEKFRPNMRGPRHIALFRTPEKLLLGETSGGYYDRKGLFANHSVQVVVSWKALEEAGAIEEKGIHRVMRKAMQIASLTDLASISEQFDLRYILGIVNSRFMRAYITSNMHEGTRKGRIYPDVWKRLPIKVASFERQQEIATLVEAIQDEYRQIEIMKEDGREEILVGIHAKLAEIERLVEALYSVPADSVLL